MQRLGQKSKSASDPRAYKLMEVIRLSLSIAQSTRRAAGMQKENQKRGSRTRLPFLFNDSVLGQ